ncbi:MAG: PQQ-binding-like beta-propeller repeat protein [Phycisphaerales bacterium]
MPNVRSSVVLSAGLAVAAFLGACAASSSTSRSSTSTTGAVRTQTQTIDPNSPTGGAVTEAHGFRISHDDWYRLGYRWDWSSLPFLMRGGHVTDLEPAGDRLLVQESGSFISVLESGSGRLVWNSQMGTRYTKFVGLQRDGDVILSSSASELFELGLETGNLLSRSSLDFLVNTSPALVGNFAIFGASNGKLLAHNRSIGLIAWAYALGGPIDTPPVLVNASTLAVVSQAGDVIFLDPLSGSSTGRAKIAGGVAYAPPTDGERLYVPSLDQSVYAYDAADASLAWRVRTEYPITKPSALYHDMLLVPLRGDGLTALDTRDGTLIWRNDELTGWVVAVHKGELIVWDGATLAAVDADRGDVIFRAQVPGASMVVPDAFEDGALYVVSRSGGIIRFRPRE